MRVQSFSIAPQQKAGSEMALLFLFRCKSSFGLILQGELVAGLPEIYFDTACKSCVIGAINVLKNNQTVAVNTGINSFLKNDSLGILTDTYRFKQNSMFPFFQICAVLLRIRIDHGSHVRQRPPLACQPEKEGTQQLHSGSNAREAGNFLILKGGGHEKDVDDDGAVDRYGYGLSDRQLQYACGHQAGFVTRTKKDAPSLGTQRVEQGQPAILLEGHFWTRGGRPGECLPGRTGEGRGALLSHVRRHRQRRLERRRACLLAALPLGFPR
jgi:hypothetical protein